jgi:hypothetical protein
MVNGTVCTTGDLFLIYSSSFTYSTNNLNNGNINEKYGKRALHKRELQIFL